jgi:3-oxoacyl-[acyl-carrier protein] reductase
VSDLLLSLGNNPMARRAVRTLGLPVPLPPNLRRAEGRDGDDALAGRRVVVLGPQGRDAGFAAVAARAAIDAGADVDAARIHADAAADASPTDAFVVDATELAQPADLRRLYDALHGRIGGLRSSGRLVVVGRPDATAPDRAAAAARAGLEGFVRALGKELGRKGSTANLLRVDEGADAFAAGPLRFLLSARAAFVSGQPLRVQSRATEPSASVALDGRSALVTGAARGIGAEIARRLAEQGARVLLLDLPAAREPLQAMAERIGGVALPFDLAAAGAQQDAIDAALAQVGRLDVLVNNAGITRDRTLAKMPPAHWDLCLAVNLEAGIGLTEALLARGGLGEGGRVVFMSSIGGIAGNPGQTNYATAKRALIGYAATLAGDLDGGRTANCIAPGFIETQMTAAMPALVREAGRRLNSLSQGGRPGDIADAVAFLASPAAAGVNGQTLRVCGQHLTGA